VWVAPPSGSQVRFQPAPACWSEHASVILPLLLTVQDGVFQLSRQASLFGVAVLVECCWPHFQSHADLKQVDMARPCGTVALKMMIITKFPCAFLACVCRRVSWLCVAESARPSLTALTRI
jgi:hypothetical protein